IQTHHYDICSTIAIQDIMCVIVCYVLFSCHFCIYSYIFLFFFFFFVFYFFLLFSFFFFFFFFQAEDGIRDLTVTGVQTCALPICHTLLPEVTDVRPLRQKGVAVQVSKPMDTLALVFENPQVPAATREALEIGRASCRERV